MRDKQLTTALRDRVFELWLKGLTYADIARNVGVTRQRVQQIVRPPKSVYDFVVKAAEGKCQDCHTETTSGHIHHIGRGVEVFNDIKNLVYLCPSCHRMRHMPANPDIPQIANTETAANLLCLRCGHTWEKRRQVPKSCPRCKQARWNVPNPTREPKNEVA